MIRTLFLAIIKSTQLNRAFLIIYSHTHKLSKRITKNSLYIRLKISDSVLIFTFDAIVVIAKSIAVVPGKSNIMIVSNATPAPIRRQDMQAAMIIKTDRRTIPVPAVYPKYTAIITNNKRKIL